MRNPPHSLGRICSSMGKQRSCSRCWWTATSSARRLEMSVNGGAAGYVLKVYTHEQLLAAVAKLLTFLDN